MKLRALAISTLSIILLFLLAFSAWGQEYPDYFALKAGVYSPTDDLDDFDFDSGFNGEIAYGHYFPPNFAVELGVGYFQSDDISVIPVTLTGQGIHRVEKFELFAGVGVGVYFAELDGVLGSFTSVDDDDFVFGVNLGLGAKYNVTKDVFIGVEGKYILTTDAEFDGVALGLFPVEVEANLNGFILTVNLGFRF